MRTFHRASTADLDISPAEPNWRCCEIDRDADAVSRCIDVFADGRITRDSIGLKRRHGGDCPSLIDRSPDVDCAETSLEMIARKTFKDSWAKSEDLPFWFPVPPDDAPPDDHARWPREEKGALS